MLQPDVAWLKARSACQKADTFYQGAPELLVEVISSTTARRDRTLKFRLYEQIKTHEYWIIDPRDLLIEAYSFQDGRLHRNTRGILRRQHPQVRVLQREQVDLHTRNAPAELRVFSQRPALALLHASYGL